MDEREKGIREACEAHGLGGLAVICVEGGVSVEVTKRLAAYVAFLTEANARKLADVAAGIVVDARAAAEKKAPDDKRKHGGH